MVPTQKSSEIFTCENCDYSTCRRSQYNRHLLTDKHKILQNPTKSYIKKFDTDKKYGCTCGKSYKHSSTLYAHKKQCCFDNSNTNENLSNQITPELILTVLEQNKELTNLVVEQNKTIFELAKNGQVNSINYNNINSNNKTFNLHFFLNETCKDAMNITDFVDSLKLQLSDLENIGRVGFVEGISNIIVKNLQALDVHKRPVHCADKKREIIYIKDEDKWEKEDEEKNKMRKVIKNVASKNQRLLSKYKEEHPGCNYSESKYSDQYSKIVIEAMGGVG